MTSKKKKIIQNVSYVIFFLAVTVLAITLILSYDDISIISKTFSGIALGSNWAWLLLAIVFAIFYFILYPTSLNVYAHALKSESTRGETYLIGASEIFYNGITPSAVGGQPFQIYALSSRNVPSDKASGMILMNYITFILSTNIYALISLIYYPHYLGALEKLNLTSLKWVAVTGFILNVLNLVICLMLGLSKHLKVLLIKLLTFLCKPKWINKHFGKLIPRFSEYCENTQGAFKELVSHRKHFIFAFLDKMLTMFCYYAIPFFILKAVNIPVGAENFFPVFFGTSFAITCIAWLPTPGGTLGIEYAFSIVITSVLQSVDSSYVMDNVQAVTLIWRSLTFYLLLILSFAESAWFQALSSRRIKKEERILELSENEEGAESLNQPSNEAANKEPAVDKNEVTPNSDIGGQINERNQQ